MKKNTESIKVITLLIGCMTWMGVQAQEPVTSEDIQQERTMKHTLILNASPGWITSKVFTPHIAYSWRFGMGYNLGYRYLPYYGFGFGIDYDYCQTSYPIDYWYDDTINLHHIEASLIYGGHIGKTWIATVEAGIGYAIYSEEGESHGGFGWKSALGIEYLQNRSVGIGLDIQNHKATFSGQKDFYGNDSEYVNGFSRFSINIGIRYHL